MAMTINQEGCKKYTQNFVAHNNKPHCTDFITLSYCKVANFLNNLWFSSFHCSMLLPYLWKCLNCDGGTSMGSDLRQRLIFITCVIQIIVLCVHFSLDTGEWRSAVRTLKIFSDYGFFLFYMMYFLSINSSFTLLHSPR